MSPCWGLLSQATKSELSPVHNVFTKSQPLFTTTMATRHSRVHTVCIMEQWVAENARKAAECLTVETSNGS
jgi:hypothetical protein